MRRIVNVLGVSGVSGVLGGLVALWLVINPAQAQTYQTQTKNGWVVLALGDSLTAGYGLSLSQAFPSQLQRALRKIDSQIKVINGGVSGDTSAGGRARLDWLLSPEIDLVLVELGANDGLRGLDPKQTRQNLDWILTRLREKGIAVVLSGMMAPPNLGADYGREFNKIFPELAKSHGVAFDPFFLKDVAARPDLNQADGIHPNAMGVQIIVNRLATLIFKQKKLTP